MRRFLMIGALLALLVAGSVSVTAAQTAAPAATGAATTCTAPRYDIRSLLKRLAATPAAEQPTPNATSTPPDTSGAKPADDATVAQVNDVMKEYIACANTGDPLKIFSFYSDRFLVSEVGSQFGGHLTPDNADQFADLLEKQMATPTAAAEQTVLDHVEQVQVLPDGRIVATVYGKKSGDQSHGTPVMFLFVKSGDTLLIDDVYDLSTPTSQGTPGA